MMVSRGKFGTPGTFEWPRRSCIDQLIPAEKLLHDAIGAIDCLPGDTTDIVMRLQEQRERLADWVEEQGLVIPE